MLDAWAFRVVQISSIKCRCNRSFETDSCTSIPGPSHCKRPCLFAVEGRRGRRSQSPWELPSPRLQPSSSKDAVSRRPETGSPVQRYVGLDKCLVGRYVRARKTLSQDRRPGDKSARLPSNKLPEQTYCTSTSVSVPFLLFAFFSSSSSPFFHFFLIFQVFFFLKFLEPFHGPTSLTICQTPTDQSRPRFSCSTKTCLIHWRHFWTMRRQVVFAVFQAINIRKSSVVIRTVSLSFLSKN